MDQLDEWMKRLEENKPSSPNPQKTNPPQEREKFNKGKQKPSKNRNRKGGQHLKHGHQQNAPQQNAPQQNAPQQKSHQHRGPKRPSNKPLKMPSMVSKKPSKPTTILRGKLKIVPLGGLDEVGKNMMAVEYEDDIVIIDMGFEFPSEDLFGIDYVIPDTTYLEENKKRIRGVLITHGHLDHIGGIPYILPKLDFPPLYGTKLTIGLALKRCEEFNLEKMAKLREIDPSQTLKLGKFTCNFFRVAHSIPDAVGIIIDSPAGKIVHTGDFKFDETPPSNFQRADVEKMESLGRQNVLALFCESTNSLKEGHSLSEMEVGKSLDKIIKEAPGRVIVASFASQIGRISQLIDTAFNNNRKVFLSGRSMVTNIAISARLGYINLRKDHVKDIRDYKKEHDENVLILTTGAQGESVSALSRMADNEHPHFKVKKGDTIIISASAIVGNERAISSVINKLSILGADVIHNQLMEVHTSGHGKQEELIRMINYVKPKYLVPVHGEFFMRQQLAKIAQKRCGLREDQIIMIKNGDVLIGEKNSLLYKSNETIETKYILIDGSGEGQIGSQVQVDREIMSQNGALIVLIYISRKNKKLVKQPDVVSRGFIYMHETEQITEEIKAIAEKAYGKIMDKNPGAPRKDIKKYIRQSIDQFTHSTLERRPLIIPLIIEA